MRGIIGFEDLLVSCIIGINPEERLAEQDLLINLQAEVDFSAVFETDDLSQAVSYAAIAETCSEISKKGQYHMLETLALTLTEQLSEKFQLSWIKILIKKPEAITHASFAYVELEKGSRKKVEI